MEDRLHARVCGRVQGVGFRFAAAREAERLGLAGWVRNDDHGSVETVAEGPRDRLETFAAWLRHGPPGARVQKVELGWEAARGEPPFHVRR